MTHRCVDEPFGLTGFRFFVILASGGGGGNLRLLEPPARDESEDGPDCRSSFVVAAVMGWTGGRTVVDLGIGGVAAERGTTNPALESTLVQNQRCERVAYRLST